MKTRIYVLVVILALAVGLAGCVMPDGSAGVVVSADQLRANTIEAMAVGCFAGIEGLAALNRTPLNADTRQTLAQYCVEVAVRVLGGGSEGIEPAPVPASADPA